MIFIYPLFAVELSFGVDITPVLVLILRTDDPDSRIIFSRKAGVFKIHFAAIPDQQVFTRNPRLFQLPDH